MSDLEGYLFGPDSLRPDGSRKGPGFLGSLKLPDGSVATEYSVGVPLDGKETDIPTLVPTLSPEEVEQMTSQVIPQRLPIPDQILQKAIAHARERIAAGKSPFMGQTVRPRARWRELEGE